VGSWEGQPVCDGNRWTGASAEDLLTGRAEPNVQCAREPPCVRWSWVRAAHVLAREHRAQRVRSARAAA
jgi:hypothetical protein